MNPRFLVTGGAGFIGSRLVARLAVQGPVCVFDNLHPQVHGPAAAVPAFAGEVAFVRGDVRDADALARAVRETAPDVVYHLAAETGTGQSHDEVVRYVEVNVTGTARLVEALRGLPAPAPGRARRRVVLASSRAVYGEGPYLDAEGRVVMGPARSAARMAAGHYTVDDPSTGAPMRPLPARAGCGVAPSSVYGSTKLMQEYLLGQALPDWDVGVLRLQNVYGAGQSLRNPYTGVLSVFCAQLLAGRSLEVFEDGEIVRDFVHVDDVVAALVAAGCRPAPLREIADIGSGRVATILQVARELAGIFGRGADAVKVSGRFRPGDIRHARADPAVALRELGWQAELALDEGLRRLARWASDSIVQGA